MFTFCVGSLRKPLLACTVLPTSLLAVHGQRVSVVTNSGQEKGPETLWTRQRLRGIKEGNADDEIEYNKCDILVC